MFAQLVAGYVIIGLIVSVWYARYSISSGRIYHYDYHEDTPLWAGIFWPVFLLWLFFRGILILIYSIAKITTK